eukprot:Gb_19956 [translate_table: standard]
MAQAEMENVTNSEKQFTAVMSAAESRPQRSFLRRIWNAIFRSSNEDFEKKLQNLSKEEAVVHTRMKRRTQAWRKFARSIILYSIILEFVVVGIAIISTRSPDLTFQMRALRVLPAFVLPALSTLLYSTCSSLHRICERKDHKTLDRLRAERKAKLDELKEQTNYYVTQQLIQRYDLDPAAKAAAASVLASKLVAESGLKLSVQDNPSLDLSQGKSHDVELVESAGLKNRKQSHGNSHSASIVATEQVSLQSTLSADDGNPQGRTRQQQGFDVEHHQRGKASEGGWIARLAALLVGEDPTQCYALICGNCHVHNGLARKEDFPYITYYCPHCHAFNGSQQTAGGDTNIAAGGANSVSTTIPNGSIVGQRQVHGIATGSITHDAITSHLCDTSVVSQTKGD